MKVCPQVLKYEESATPKESKSESTKSLQPPKSRSLRVRRVCNPERLGVLKYEESETPKDSKPQSTKSFKVRKTRSLMVGVCNPQRFEVWMYEEFQSPKGSESGKYEDSATPKESKSESTKSLQHRKTRSL